MRKLKVFAIPWHVGHQYELFKLPFAEFHLLIQPIRKWALSSRPLPDNVKFVSHYEPGKYDLAIFNLDQQCIDPALGKSKLFRAMDKLVTDIPKIVIEHGTPCWPEKYKTEKIVRKTKWLTRNFDAVVVNSHQAKKDWGQGTTIIHGLDPKEWYDLPKEARLVTSISPAGLDRYYNRRLLESVKGMLSERGIRHVHIMSDIVFADPEDYKEFLGRSLLYFNPTWQSPMPRSRSEAMLSGCCVITTFNQDEDTFIDGAFRAGVINANPGSEDYNTAICDYADGLIERKVNGFLVKNNPWLITDLIEHLLLRRYKEAKEIGQRGKVTATLLFDQTRYQDEWRHLIAKVLKINVNDLYDK